MKQRNIPWLGALMESFYTALPMLNSINMLLIMVVAYDTVSRHLQPIFPGFNFWWFIALVLIAFVILMIVCYKFLVPSMWTFRNKQMNDFESSILEAIGELQKEVEALKAVK